MLNYCVLHAMRELSILEYWNPKSKLGKSIVRLSGPRYSRCGGAYANENRCKKWGIFHVGFISKRIAILEHKALMRR